MTVSARTVPHDTKDDVLEKFLSKILPGSGTVYRSERKTTSAPAAGSTRPPTADTRQTGNRTSAAAAAAANRSSSLPTSMLQSALYNEAAMSAPSLRKTKRRLCKTVPMASRDGNQVRMNTICYHVSDDETASP